jgi:delta24-sterol reductase
MDTKRSLFLAKLTEVMIEYRWLFVVPIVLPLSFLFNVYWKARDLYVRSFLSFGRSHDKTVARIQEQVRAWRASGSRKLLCTARPSWLQLSMRDNQYKREHNAIEMPLYDIGHLDTEKRTVVVEPYVNVGQLSQFLIARGWTTPIVPELDDLTLGGLFFGYGIEGSSHKYGLLSDIVESCDVVVADGTLVHCSDKENVELFRALPWSHGSLGFLVSLELHIIPCKPFVRLTYEPVFGLDHIVTRFAETSEAPQPHEFVEALLFNKDRGVLMYGDFVDEVGDDGKLNAIGKSYKPWYAFDYFYHTFLSHSFITLVFNTLTHSITLLLNSR